MTSEFRKSRKPVTRGLAVMSLLGFYFGASLGIITIALATPAAAQQNKHGHGQGHDQGQPKHRKRNTGAKIFGGEGGINIHIGTPRSGAGRSDAEEAHRRHIRRHHLRHLRGD